MPPKAKAKADATTAAAAAATLERRLRPVYDAIDAGNIKQALKTIQGILSKNSDNVRVLALRAYILQRLGRSEEAVDAALKILRDHRPEDPGVLTPLQYVFRSNKKPAETLELLELLSRSTDTSSTVLLELFDECLRQGLTLKQQQTGMKLYNNDSTEKHLLYCVSSLLMQALEEEDKGKDSKKLLNLADMLVGRHIAKHGMLGERESIKLYLKVLEHLGAHQKILDTLDDQNAQKVLPRGYWRMRKSQAMEALELWSQSASILLEILTDENPDDWLLAKTYLEHYLKAHQKQVLGLHQEKSAAEIQHLMDLRISSTAQGESAEGAEPLEEGGVGSVFQHMFETAKGLAERSDKKLRCFHLSCVHINVLRLDVASKIPGLAVDGDPRLSAAVNGVISSLREYLQVFGSKPCCHYDISSFLEIVSQYPEASRAFQQSLLSDVENGVKRSEAQAAAEDSGGHDEDSLRRSLNDLKVALALEARGSRSGPFLVRLVKVLCTLYAISVRVTRVDKDEFDANISFEYLIAIADVLLELVACPDSYHGEEEDDDNKEQEMPRETFLVLSAIAFLNQIVKKSEFFFEANLRLVALHSRMGAPESAFKSWLSLEPKHIQHDILSHYILVPLHHYGALTLFKDLRSSIHRLHSSHEESGPSFYGKAFQHGNFLKAIEMKAFADQMKTSHTLATSAALWHKTRCCQHAEDLAKVQDILDSACIGPSMLERGSYLRANSFAEPAQNDDCPPSSPPCPPSSSSSSSSPSPPSRRLSFNEDVHLIPECYVEWMRKPVSQTTTIHGLSKYASSVPTSQQMQWAMDLSQTQRLLIVLRELLQASPSSFKSGDGDGNGDDTESLVTLAGEIDSDVSEGHKVGRACLELMAAAVSFKKFKAQSLDFEDFREKFTARLDAFTSELAYLVDEFHDETHQQQQRSYIVPAALIASINRVANLYIPLFFIFMSSWGVDPQHKKRGKRKEVANSQSAISKELREAMQKSTRDVSDHVSKLVTTVDSLIQRDTSIETITLSSSSRTSLVEELWRLAELPGSLSAEIKQAAKECRDEHTEFLGEIKTTLESHMRILKQIL